MNEKNCSNQADCPDIQPFLDLERVAGCVHDLLQPLTAIDNFAETGRRLAQRDGEIPPQIHELFSRIREQAGRMRESSEEIQALVSSYRSTRERAGE